MALHPQRNGGAFTASFIKQELVAAETRLQEIQSTLGDGANLVDNQEENVLAEEADPLPVRLARVAAQAQELTVANEYAKWQKGLPLENEEDANEEQQEDSSSRKLWQDVLSLERLGHLLQRHASNRQSSKGGLYQEIYEHEYLVLHQDLRARLIWKLRNDLKRANYPSDSSPLMQEFLSEQSRDKVDGSNDGENDAAEIGQTCQGLVYLSSLHASVTSHVKGTSGSNSNHKEDVLTELCRPIVEAVRFHFCTPSPDRPTSTRIDRLPEWLLQYLQQQVFTKRGGPWEFVHEGLSPVLVATSTDSGGNSGGAQDSLSLDFINELIRLVQWVLHEREFFRHATVTGPQSKSPHLLAQAIDQLLQFDGFVRQLLVGDDDNETSVQQQVNQNKYRIVSLMDVFVAGDEELLAWWLDREKESVFSCLLQDSEGLPKSLVHRVSPRAELFCSLIRSVQTKAAAFSFSGPYLQHVGVPLCMQFVDALHESATDLGTLLRRHKRRANLADLESNLTCWIELINGTHMAAAILSANTKEEQQQTQFADLARFGRSLERLQEVMIQDLCTALVESILMEGAKLASYLMRCSHTLTLARIDDTHDMSSDLDEARAILQVFLSVCQESDQLLATTNMSTSTRATHDLAHFAPTRIKEAVLTFVAQKFLEVALDEDGMTPDLFQASCRNFCSDVHDLFGRSMLPASVLRLLDVVNWMAMDRQALVVVGDALCGLAGHPAPLTMEIFSADERLFDEAESMIRAKGYVWLELGDVLAVLNRRRDLGPNPLV